jgi:disulfide bond formation protein DsbB
MMTDLAKARALALLLPAALMAGALGSQYIGHLYPCEMCHWQRWGHYAAIAFALLAILTRNSAASRPLVLLAAIGILSSGLIGAFHAGVEYHWWQGFTTCSAPGSGSFADIMNAPLIRCDQAQWTLFGISLAGFNAIISIGGALTIFGLCLNRPR